MTLFLHVVAPGSIPEKEFEDFEFTKDDIINLCKLSLDFL